MHDRDFLIWIHGRLENVYGENPQVDFMCKLRSVINATDPKKCTPNIGEAIAQQETLSSTDISGEIHKRFINTIKDVSQMTDDEIVVDFYERLNDDEIAEVLNTKKEDLILQHMLAGMHIRNYYKLNERNWVPVIVNGVDESPDNPDNKSMRIIEKVWLLAHANNR